MQTMSIDISPEFDAYSENYDASLGKGLALTGEDKDFFARERTRWLGRRLAQLDESPESVLDFGCGTGSATPYLFDSLGISKLIGIDVSSQSIAIAEQSYSAYPAQFQVCSEFSPTSDIDLAFTNGVFHHIPPAQRSDALAQIYAALRPGGLLAFWENNPWNPGTRLIMSRIPFDRDAIMLWPHGARQLLRAAGFEMILTDFAFIFPNFLRRLRVLEKRLCRLALGGQYMILARKPLDRR
jgi:SAM-dependent methyltransferase